MKKYIMAAALVMGFAAAANAQENKLVVKPSGRILMDAAFLNSSNKAVDEQCVDGVNVPDIRIGMKVSYGKWEGKADIGYARGSVSPKDIFIQYNFAYKVTLLPYFFDQTKFLHSSVAPVVSMSLFTMSTIARFTRNEMVEVIDSDYVRTERQRTVLIAMADKIKSGAWPSQRASTAAVW